MTRLYIKMADEDKCMEIFAFNHADLSRSLKEVPKEAQYY